MYKIDDINFLTYLNKKVASFMFDEGYKNDFSHIVDTKVLTALNIKSLVVYLTLAETAEHDDDFILMHTGNKVEAISDLFQLKRENNYLKRYLYNYFWVEYTDDGIVIMELIDKEYFQCLDDANECY